MWHRFVIVEAARAPAGRPAQTRSSGVGEKPKIGALRLRRPDEAGVHPGAMTRVAVFFALMRRRPFGVPPFGRRLPPELASPTPLVSGVAGESCDATNRHRLSPPHVSPASPEANPPAAMDGRRRGGSRRRRDAATDGGA